MSKPKHTPGPWKLEPFEREDGTGIAVIDEAEKVLAWIYWISPNAFGNMVMSTLPNEENARLMAAAPELLKECKYALEFLNDWATANQCAHDQGYQNFKFRLELAIAKAEQMEGQEVENEQA